MFSDILLSIDIGTYFTIQSSTEETEIIDIDPLSRLTPRDQATSRIPRDHVTSRSRAPSHLIFPLSYRNLSRHQHFLILLGYGPCPDFTRYHAPHHQFRVV